MTHISAHMG